MIYSNFLLFICLIGIGGHVAFNNKVNAQHALTKQQCIHLLKSIDSIPKYLEFANKLISDQNGLSLDETIVINKCLHSVNGLEDIKLLTRIVEKSSTIHSVCEPEFTNELIQFDKQMKDNINRGNLINKLFKRKHRLSRFYRMFAGQVILTCKKSLAQKLQLVEENNIDLVENVNRMVEMSKRSQTPPDLGKTKSLSPVMHKLLNLVMKYKPTIFKKVENLILIESLKPSPDAEFSFGVTLNSEKSLNEFIKTKRACKMIDQYAQSSIYTIARLAWKGYLARNDESSLDMDLIENERVQRWIQAVQVCQGILMIKANLDLEQDVLEKLDQEALKEEQIFTIQLSRDNNEEQVGTKAYKYELSDTFNEFDAGLQSYTHSKGLTGWLLKRVGSKSELLLAKYIKLSFLDDSIKQSLIESNQPDSEEEVQFVGTTAHVMTFHPVYTIPHGSNVSSAKLGIAFAIAIGVLLFLVAFSFFVSWMCNRD